MNNIWIIFEREYLERVRKRSFLIATILTPLIIPLIGALAVFLTSLDDGKEKTIYLIDEAGLFPEGLTISEYVIEQVVMSVDEAKENLNGQDTYGVLYIPELDIDNPKGIEFYSKSSPGLTFLSKFRRPIKERIETLKMKEMQLDAKVIARLKTSVDISTFNVSESGESKKSSAAIASGIGYFMAFLTYMFVFVYGSFIMQSVLNEKTSKIVEVIVSSVKPFQLMLGKVLANGAVALTQFGLWIFLISTFFFVLGTYFGIDPRAEQQQMIQEQMQAIQQLEQAGSEAPQFVVDIFEVIQSLPIAKIVLTFLYYFLGGFLLFGALFAAVGSAVDSLQEAQ
ncbi:MAG: ABC transporter permease, partial [Cyclobacteriaceae bacterium]|nr:ABC transporter permease [Cyclobacteriaceae bacterium HetDA_MAG_MS6]